MLRTSLMSELVNKHKMEIAQPTPNTREQGNTSCTGQSQQARCSRCSCAEGKRHRQLRKQRCGSQETLACQHMGWEQTRIIIKAESGSRKWLQLAFRDWQWIIISNWSINQGSTYYIQKHLSLVRFILVQNAITQGLWKSWPRKL